MCHVLGLTPSPNNGTWGHVTGMLKSHDSITPHHLAVSQPLGMILLGTTVTCATALIVIVVGIFIHKRCHRKRGLNYTALMMNAPEHD